MGESPIRGSDGAASGAGGAAESRGWRGERGLPPSRPPSVAPQPSSRVVRLALFRFVRLTTLVGTILARTSVSEIDPPLSARSLSFRVFAASLRLPNPRSPRRPCASASVSARARARLYRSRSRVNNGVCAVCQRVCQRASVLLDDDDDAAIEEERRRRRRKRE